MGSSTASHIIVKSGKGDKPYSYKDFYGPLDKGAAKPSFCYPSRRQDLEEEVHKGEKLLEDGYVSKDKEMEFKITLKTKQKRLDDLSVQEADARKLFEENKDALIKRRSELAKEIASEMPSREAVKKRLVNPHATLKKEKGGLEEKKREFIILSRLAGEESNVSFLQKDKG